MAMDNEKIKQTKVNMIEAAKAKNLEEAYMLSELVDNSLSSWLKHNDDNPEGLIVEINYTEGEKPEKNRIVVTDNAYGIDKKDMGVILTPGARNKKDTDLNIFGFGLKDAAFWAGKILKFKTLLEGQKEAVEAVVDLNGEPSEEPEIDYVEPYAPANAIKFMSGNQTLNYHGSQVIIEDLYNDTRKFSQLADNIKEISEQGVKDSGIFSKQEFTIPVIASKYKRWLEKGLRIIFSFTKDGDIDAKEERTFALSKDSISTFDLQTENVSRDLDELIDALNKQLSPEKQITKEEAISEILSKIKVKTESQVEEWIRVLNTDEPLVHTYDLQVGDIASKVTYGYLAVVPSKKYWYRYSGLYMYQYNRTICTGPNKSGQNYARTYEIPGADRTRDNKLLWRRLYGIMDIDEFVKEKYIALDPNKKGINQSNSDRIGEFNTAIGNCAKEFTELYAPLLKAMERWFSTRDIKAEGITYNPQEQKDVMDAIGMDKAGVYNVETGDIESIDEETPDKPIVYRIEIDGNPLMFTFEEWKGDKRDVYPYSKTVAYTTEGDPFYKFKVNSNSALFLPLLKGDLETRNADAIIEKVKEVFYKMAIVEIVYDTYQREILEKNSGRPKWVDALSEKFGDDDDKMKDYLAEIVCRYDR